MNPSTPVKFHFQVACGLKISTHDGKYSFVLSIEKEEFTASDVSRIKAKEKAAIETLLNITYRFNAIPTELLKHVLSTEPSQMILDSPSNSVPVNQNQTSPDLELQPSMHLKPENKVDDIMENSKGAVQEQYVTNTDKCRTYQLSIESHSITKVPVDSPVSSSLETQQGGRCMQTNETITGTKNLTPKDMCNVKRENDRIAPTMVAKPFTLSDNEFVTNVIQRKAEGQLCVDQSGGQVLPTYAESFVVKGDIAPNSALQFPNIIPSNKKIKVKLLHIKDTCYHQKSNPPAWCVSLDY